MDTDTITTIEPGFVWPNGLVLNEAETLAYNLYQTKLEQTRDPGICECIRHRRRVFIRELTKAAGLR